MKKQCVFFMLIALLLLQSCQPTSLDEFQYEGACQVELLLKEMEQIETREDLVRMEPVLKKRFEKIAALVIQAKAFQQKNPDLEPLFLGRSILLSEALLDEMRRVYTLEGGRESVERAQRESMLKLDAQCRKN